MKMRSKSKGEGIERAMWKLGGTWAICGDFGKASNPKARNVEQVHMENMRLYK